MTPRPTGRIVQEADGLVLVLVRDLAASVEDVWASVSQPERMERWIGTWRGDPGSGHVTFLMTAEGDAAEDEQVEIRACEPPHHYAVTTRQGGGAWHMEVHVEPHGAGARLTFRQTRVDPGEAASFGTGWEYYLDRLRVSLDGGDVTSVDFARDYDPAMVGHFRDQLP